MVVFLKNFDNMWRDMKCILKKQYILIFVSILVILQAIFLNVFYPMKNESRAKEKYSSVGVKADFKNASKRYVDGDVVGLGFGYLLGEKSELPSGVGDKMKTVGLAHIIVVSGTHLSIIISFSRKIFEKISRFAALYFSIFLLILYVSLIGWSPSTIRASFVAILSIVAWFFGREQRVYRTVIFTLAFCLLVNPYFLTNISFQLSMLAYSGVVIIMPKMIIFFYGRDKPGFLGSIILSSLSAIIACLPIQLYYFGSMNLIAILANLLILPTVSFAMGFMFLTGLVGLFHVDFLAIIFGKVAELILRYHIKIISILEEKSEFLFTFKQNNPAFLLLYVGMVMFLGAVAIYQNIKIRKSNTSYHCDTLVRVDVTKDVAREIVERDELCDAPRAERDDKRGKNCRFDDS
jgi:ComEC/Rec2-related protein